MQKGCILTCLGFSIWRESRVALATAISQAGCGRHKPVNEIAQEITVFMDNCSSGSGVLFEKQGNTYSVLTARHVVREDVDCLVITPDGQRHQAKANKFKRYEGLDLAVVQFESDKKYQLGELEKSENATIGQIVYVTGAPEPNETIQKRALRVSDGKIISTPPEGTLGYTLVYNNTTKRGMSGGPVLDEQGRVIGIHGRGDQADGSKENYGIPIQKFLTAKVSQNEADNYISKGIALYDKGNYKESIAAYSRAIEINPNYAIAYTGRGIVRSYLGDKHSAIADYDQAIKLNPNFASAYTGRGNARSNLGDKQGVIADYDQAIKLNPNDADAYYNRRIARDELGDKQGAIADYDQAIKINPNYVNAYYNRGLAHSDLGDKQSAIADYDQAIKINPNYANAYYSRGLVH